VDLPPVYLHVGKTVLSSFKKGGKKRGKEICPLLTGSVRAEHIIDFIAIPVIHGYVHNYAIRLFGSFEFNLVAFLYAHAHGFYLPVSTIEGYIDLFYMDLAHTALEDDGDIPQVILFTDIRHDHVIIWH
jgi:hypothetical protein